MYIQIKEEKTAILKIYLKTLKVLERQKFSKYFAPIDIVKIETCFRNNKKAKNEGKKKMCSSKKNAIFRCKFTALMIFSSFIKSFAMIIIKNIIEKFG